MKDIYTKLSEALAKLKEASGVKYHEVATKITTLSTIEAKLNCVEEALGKKISDQYESSGSKAQATLDEFQEAYGKIKASGWLPRFKSLVQDSDSIETRLRICQELFKEEAPRSIKMNNGREHNGYGNFITETTDPFATGDALLRESLGIPEQKQPEGLTEAQSAEYEFARAVGLCESDAMVLAKLPFTEARRPRF